MSPPTSYGRRAVEPNSPSWNGISSTDVLLNAVAMSFLRLIYLADELLRVAHAMCF